MDRGQYVHVMLMDMMQEVGGALFMYEMYEVHL
jgi:hypothetical protein